MRLLKPTYEESSDEELMRQLSQGDERAFDQLYRRYHRKMLHYFYRLLNQEEGRAQDMLQDLFMKLIEKPHLYNPERRFSTWLYAIASNMVKNEYRSRSVRKIMTRPGDMSQVSVPVDPEEAYLDRDIFTVHLQHGLEHLSAKHREVILLRFQDELSIKQISEITTCSEGTVKSRLFYGLRKLAQSLAVFDPKK